MSVLKELLLLLTTMMHMSLMTSHPVGLKSCEEKLDEIDFKMKVGFVLQDLKMAESAFVKHFGGSRSNTHRNQKPLDGITFPVGNTTDRKTLNSMCAIEDYLTNHLPPILSNLTLNNTIKETILDNASKIQFPFDCLVRLMDDCQNKDRLRECPRKLPALKTYGMKTHALQILHGAVSWTESYTNNNLP